MCYALDEVGKDYNYKRLMTDEGYRQGLIDWLSENGINMETYPIESREIEQFYERITKDKVLEMTETLNEKGH